MKTDKCSQICLKFKRKKEKIQKVNVGKRKIRMNLTKTARGQPMKNGTIKMMYLARVRNLMKR
jgi:hypothetical protein